MLNKFSLPNLPFFSFDYTAYSTVWNCERLHSCYIAGFLWKRTGWRHTLTIHVFVSARIVVKQATEKTTYFFGSAEEHYPRATVYRRPRRPAAADWPWRDVSSARWAECGSVAVLPRQIAVQCDEQMNGQTYRSVSMRVVLPHGIRRRVYCDSRIFGNIDWLALQYCIRQMACSVECWPARAIAVINDVCCCHRVCCYCSVCQLLV